MFPQAIVEGKVIFREILNVREVFKHFFSPPRAWLKGVFGSAVTWNWYSRGEVKRKGWRFEVNWATRTLIEFFIFLKGKGKGPEEGIKKRLRRLLVSRKEAKKKKKRFVFCAAHLLCWHLRKCPHGAALELRCSARAPVCRVHQQFHHLSCRNCFSSESSLDFKQSSVTLQIIFYFIFSLRCLRNKKAFCRVVRWSCTWPETKHIPLS